MRFSPLIPLVLVARALGADATLPNTKPLDWEGDIAARMVAGIDRWLMRELAAAPGKRKEAWRGDERALSEKRARLRKIIGAVDPRMPPAMELVATLDTPALVAKGPNYSVYAVRWPVLEGVDAEGLLLKPEGAPKAHVVALPDADWTPEMIAGLVPTTPSMAHYARHLASAGFQVLVPTLIDRKDTWSNSPALNRMTNQSHREFVYRMAFEMGRHPLGYEVQKVLAGVDWFAKSDGAAKRPVGVIGYGEGGLVALLAAAVDTRINAAMVSGGFGRREDIWREPIYRNLWAYVSEFGDAGAAALVAPRDLIIESVPGPVVPEAVAAGAKRGAGPGRLVPATRDAVVEEARLARSLGKPAGASDGPPMLVGSDQEGTGVPGTDQAMQTFTSVLGGDWYGRRFGDGQSPTDLRKDFDPAPRQKRQFDQLCEHVQRLLRRSGTVRSALWAKADVSSPEKWNESVKPLRAKLWEEVIGKLPALDRAAEPRSRKIYDEPKYVGYEVVLDCYQDVFAYGILLLPKDLKAGEKRPVVVCQHGLEGRPQDVCDPAKKNVYYNFAGALANRGFIVYAPQNPYIGKDDFRVLQRKANPLGLSLFSFILRQHERTLQWLSSLPEVDASRIGFYGLSYGGKTAMRVPALLEKYCLSICSGDFNEWIHKNTSNDFAGSYLWFGEYEMFEFDLGHTFNYAEMAELICPRPFMVERGHKDGVGIDEWVAYEYAKVRRRYAQLGIADRTEIEFFNGVHQINGQGTYDFLHRHLKWPAK